MSFFVLFKAQCAPSSIDIILYGLVTENDTIINIDLLNECFRLLHTNGYLITHIERSKQRQITNYFKMCGFIHCNPLDSNSSFLVENKDEQIKRSGSLWFCQKPPFDIGYSVSLRRPGVSLIRQISTSILN